MCFLGVLSLSRKLFSLDGIQYTLVYCVRKETDYKVPFWNWRDDLVDAAFLQLGQEQIPRHLREINYLFGRFQDMLEHLCRG